MTSLIVWSASWAIAVGLIFLAILRTIEIDLDDQDRQVGRDAIRSTSLENMAMIEFVYPHEQVAWDDLTRETSLFL